MTDERNIQNEQIEEQEIDIVGLIFKYLYYWPWFILSVIVCGGLAFLYLKYQAPVYQVNASVLIKEDDNRSGSMKQNMEMVQDLGMLTMTSKFDNEVEILKSRTLAKKVVNDLGLFIQQSEPRSFGYAIPKYKTSPLVVYMTPEEADQLPSALHLDLTYAPSGALQVGVTYTEEGEEKNLAKNFQKLPAVFPTPVGVITISPRDSVKIQQPITLEATISSPTAIAAAYVANLSVTPSSKTTTIAKIAVKNTIKSRGVDFINTLISNYNQDANDEKNQVAQRTAEFIQERIGIINNELGTTENKMADFKQRSGLTDISSDAQLALQENSKYEQQRTQNATQIRMVQFLWQYINDPINNDEVIPSNVGLTDHNLTSVIDKYNTLIIERKRLLRTSSEHNPAVVQMNTGIEAMRRNVKTTVSSVLKGLEIAQADIDRQAGKFRSRISTAPIKEKEFMSIARQQEIQAALYIMLLQKREENAITLASTANNGRIIEEPLAAGAPVAPKKMMIFLAAFMIGLVIPVIIIFIKEMLRFKIETVDDIASLTNLPLIAEIPLTTVEEGKGSIVIQENRNEMMEETFRSLRTNILFMMKPTEKVIMVSSTQPQEGKSFVAGNLAVSLAYLGKKVLVVGLDLRRPGLNKIFQLSRKKEGISNYLSDPEHTDLLSLIQPSEVTPNLDILTGGSIPPNPTELVARDTLEKAIDQLKEKYDYIILDSAPIAMVTDSSIIARVDRKSVV